MDSLAERILRLFDELRRERLDLHAFFEMVGGNRPAEQGPVLDAVARLVEQGLLRSGGGDFYTRTEDGRVAIAGPLEVTFYTRKDCRLCEEAKQQMAPLLHEFGARLREVDIDSDTELRERYTNDVPVVFLASRKVAKHRVDLAQFRRQLGQARG